MRPRGETKRSKTFTGCRTCRLRSVKCGEEKPACRRCRNSGLTCAGYGIGLVWPGQKVSNGTQRRMLLDTAQSSRVFLSERDVDSALETIDSAADGACLTVKLFSVFPTTSSVDHPQWNAPSTSSDATGVSPPPTNLEVNHLDLSQAYLSSPRAACSVDDFEQQWCSPRYPTPPTWPGPIEMILPALDGFSLFADSRRERQLMHYWVTFLSGLMTPTPRVDNIFHNIFTTLAFLAKSTYRNSPAYQAFLHSLYAFAALSHTRLHDSSLFGRETGGRHVEKSLQYLSQGLTSSTQLEEQQAVLATIITLSVIPAFTGDGSDWRVHFRGGLAWLHTTDKSAWKYSRTTSTLYQFLVCLETLRPAQYNVAKDLPPQRFSLRHPELPSPESGDRSKYLDEERDYQEEEEDGGETDWYLSDVFGITRPILEIIHQINQWLFDGISPPAQELDQLELRIYRNNPEKSRFSGPDERCREMAWHHARAFYCACHIYLGCTLRRRSPKDHIVSSFVRQGIEHIEAFGLLEQDLNVSGLMWPAFITACETEQADLRLRVMKYFDKRERWGIANVTEAKEVILNVWRRKDEAPADQNVLWHDVMAEMGADIILS
ncbi:hypothetical protein A1O3_03651 [Capronia epimyces CBS 606.96]|uniref:Zn(2)-C6 fungal-type domain-containing protein n=1 Tax=Capronia epimyces CBS 606.96 TaxID=1182542 RepID=W9Y2G6_9EURO|nr:uncharacterized protein A1O3_03651 [Capronia epimyces CBS 606.96]EXJ86698.1 hypothetical protein A1O3_03651 [Capronia epimyces CBS 606.96]